MLGDYTHLPLSKRQKIAKEQEKYLFSEKSEEEQMKESSVVLPNAPPKYVKQAFKSRFEYVLGEVLPFLRDNGIEVSPTPKARLSQKSICVDESKICLAELKVIWKVVMLSNDRRIQRNKLAYVNWVTEKHSLGIFELLSFKPKITRMLLAEMGRVIKGLEVLHRRPILFVLDLDTTQLRGEDVENAFQVLLH
jgi:hypothetical protein